MSSQRKLTLIAGAAAGIFAMIYAAPLFGAALQVEPAPVMQIAPVDEALMAPLRLEAQTALADLQARARHD